MTPTHRLATLADLEQIVAIYNSTVPGRLATADTEPVSVASRAAWFGAHRPASRPLWVIELHGRIAAWLSFSSFYGRPAYAHSAELGLYVHADHRRAGLGRYLLTHAIDHAPRIGVAVLLGFIFGHNEPSLRLFGSSGFERWGILPRVARMDGIERDLQILGRRTDGGGGVTASAADSPSVSSAPVSPAPAVTPA